MVERDPRWPVDAPTDHLDTVEYWRDLYRDAIKVGQEMLAETRTQPRLGLATTRELLTEIKARGEVSHTIGEYPDEMGAMAIGAANLLDTLPGSMLDYSTVGSSSSPGNGRRARSRLAWSSRVRSVRPTEATGDHA